MRFPKLLHNRLSYAGLAIATLSLTIFVLLMVLHTFTGTGRAPYAGLVIFVAVPAVLVLGIVLVPAGMVLEWLRWRHRGGKPLPRFPAIDLNNPRHRNAVLAAAGGTVWLLFLLAFNSYQGYRYTESVTFCGTLCHTVMKPEYTTYQNSPHARVACVECHVGSGATWFVRSKISGVPQIFATIFDTFPRPIPARIVRLRPAQETCEQCHWPEAFYGGQQKKFVHFLPDEVNTRWEIDLLIKTGGGSVANSQTQGIHWHMNIADRIEYITTDKERQTIPWVRMTNLKTGKTTEFESTENPLTQDRIASSQKRVMDCMDCHNRPSHRFRSPSDAVNLALATGAIDPTLPFIKKLAVTLLATTYESQDQALKAVEDKVTGFYREKYPRVLGNNPQAVAQAVRAIQHLFRTNIFPEMKARWDVYPSDVGHLVFAGCDRCHDGQHKSADGRVITTDCRACHTILSQGKVEQITFATQAAGLDFQHPVDIDEEWQDTACSECHTGELP